MAARSSGPRFFASNGTMHHAIRFVRAKSWCDDSAAIAGAPTDHKHTNIHGQMRRTRRGVVIEVVCGVSHRVLFTVHCIFDTMRPRALPYRSVRLKTKAPKRSPSSLTGRGPGEG